MSSKPKEEAHKEGIIIAVGGGGGFGKKWRSSSRTRGFEVIRLSRNESLALFYTFLTPAAPGVDVEGLEVVKECLAEVFDLHTIPPDADSLIDIFQQSHRAISGTDADSVFGQFIGALEGIQYFKTTPDGNDDPVQMDRASTVFYTAVQDLQSSASQLLDSKNIADSFKSQGNKAVQSNHFSEAIEFYTFAIALDLNNAVYYCNSASGLRLRALAHYVIDASALIPRIMFSSVMDYRAAAYTQIHQYAEAIEDCLKAVKIDPNYSKAYSRLGFAYYAQGKYADAIEKGFSKDNFFEPLVNIMIISDCDNLEFEINAITPAALRLDPDNEYVKENIRVAEQKLREENQRAQHNQNFASSSHHEQPNHQSARGPRTSMPFNLNHVPPELASYFMNMTQRMNSHGGPADGIHVDEGTGVSGNIDINFGGQMPAEDSSAANRNGQPNQQSAGGPRTAMPFNLNDLTPEVASIFSNMRQGWHSHGGPEDADNPGIEGNININIGEQMPAEVGVALRSVMEMFSGATPGGGEDNANRRSSS
ncbi:hypothetical protein Leryth_011609 [Lithospermum erythrorhizon]|nr:hypothetical protein Leryth_011609 [Lithospermum erythrorhizon]